MEYEELRKLCLRILWNEGANCFGADGDELDEIKGVLVYTPGLWVLLQEIPG